MTSCKQVCKPVDCKLGTWSAWTAPLGYGLCRRERSVKTEANECGASCFPLGQDVSMAETKDCPVDASPVDCRISTWSAWSKCENPEALHYRMRIVEGYPRNGGKNCRGPLQEVESCYLLLKPVDCNYVAWSDWSTCNAQGSPKKA